MLSYYSLLILLEIFGVYAQQGYYRPNVQFAGPRRLENPNALQEEEERFFASRERDRYQLPAAPMTESPESIEQRRFQQEIADAPLKEQQRLSLGLPNTVRLTYDQNNNYGQGQLTGPVLFNPQQQQQQETLYSIFNQESRSKRKGSSSIVFPRSIDYWRGTLSNISETATLLSNLNKLKSRSNGGDSEVYEEAGMNNNNAGQQYASKNDVINEQSKYNTMEIGDDLLHNEQSQSNNMTDNLSTLALFVKIPKNVPQNQNYNGNEKISERNNRKVVTGNKNELRSTLVYRTPPGKKIEKDFGYHNNYNYVNNNVNKRMGVFPNIYNNRGPMINMLQRLRSV